LLLAEAVLNELDEVLWRQIHPEKAKIPSRVSPLLRMHKKSRIEIFSCLKFLNIYADYFRHILWFCTFCSLLPERGYFFHPVRQSLDSLRHSLNTVQDVLVFATDIQKDVLHQEE